MGLTSLSEDDLQLHQDAFVFDGHNDAAIRLLDGEDLSGRLEGGHLDLPRMREAGFDGGIFALRSDPESERPLEVTLDAAARFGAFLEETSGMRQVLGARDLEEAEGAGEIAVVVGVSLTRCLVASGRRSRASRRPASMRRRRRRHGAYRRIPPPAAGARARPRRAVYSRCWRTAVCESRNLRAFLSSALDGRRRSPGTQGEGIQTPLLLKGMNMMTEFPELTLEGTLEYAGRLLRSPGTPSRVLRAIRSGVGDLLAHAAGDGELSILESDANALCEGLNTLLGELVETMKRDGRIEIKDLLSVLLVREDLECLAHGLAAGEIRMIINASGNEHGTQERVDLLLSQLIAAGRSADREIERVVPWRL